MIQISTYEQSTYAVLALVPSLSSDIRKGYFESFDIPLDEVAVAQLHVEPKQKKAALREYIDAEVIPAIQAYGVKYVLCSHAEYFRTLVGIRTPVNESLGYVFPIPETDAFAVYVPDIRTKFYNPTQFQSSMELAMHGFLSHARGAYDPPGTDILRNIEYCKTDEEVEAALERLLQMNVPLTSDIEAFSLKHYSAGIGTITFCWDQYSGIAFSVDYLVTAQQSFNEVRRDLLRRFFERFQNKMIYHNASYDVTVLISQLFMKNIIDTEGLLYGIDVMLRNFEDTKIIAYLATNSCADTPLGLKQLSHEFTGKYAMEDIDNICKITVEELLKYNVIDGLATWYVYSKYYPIMVADNQEKLYLDLFKPILIDIIQMQLTGMPLNMETTKKVAHDLKSLQDSLNAQLANHPVIHSFKNDLAAQYVEKMHKKWKKKRITVADVDIPYNPASPQQTSMLLYEFMQLPIINRTKSGAPSADKETLKSLVNHATTEEFKEVLGILLDLADLSNILSTFIPAFLNAPQGPDGWHYVFGFFNLGGTVSGRLSSSDINLQNLPATKSKYAEAIKRCFEAPEGWLFVGLDFDSLEDKISALTTRDPNKLKVYTDGFDGHSLRAYGYWPDRMPDIDPNSVESINSIAIRYKKLRQNSKTPTFALTYLGTWRTLMKKCGFTEEESKIVESRFKALYIVSIEWVASKLKEASRRGYIEAAFGLRIRTPLLAQTILGTKTTPKETAKESRTAGNALGQSWCLLNNRAQVAFMRRVREGKHRLDIRPCGTIHDAQYYMIREDIHVLKYVNDHLIPEVEWQDHDAIRHPTVGLSGKLDVFYPTWANGITLSPNSSIEEIYATIDNALNKQKD